MSLTVVGFAASPRAALFSGVACLTLTLPAVAHAQDGDVEYAEAAPAYEEAAPAAGDFGAEGNGIVVTATKREQTLQDVPVAVTVTTAETLERDNIRDLKDLQTVVPSLRVTQLQSIGSTNFIIRGFGNGANNAGIEPSVGVFVDGVYRSRTASQINDLPDVQRVEVLRGPQSTLFGKNASAGVISIATREPQFNFGGGVEASYGNYDAMVLKGYVTGPLGDSVAASLGAGFNKRDGYLQDLGTGNATNERDRWFVRGQLLVEPAPDWKVRIIGDYDSINENCCGVVNLQSSQATGAILALGGMVTDPADPFADVIYNNFDSRNEIENYGISAEIDYNLGPLTFTSITSKRRSNSLSRQDPDFTSADLIYPFLTDVQLDTFTQELRVSAEIGNFFSGLFGVFYINEDVDQTGAVQFGSQFRDYADLQVQGATGGALSVAALEQSFGALEGDPAKYVGRFFTQGTGLDEAYTLGSEAFSVFGQLDVQVTDGLTLTLGGNYTKDSKRFTTGTTTSDVFSTIDFDAAQYAPFRYQLLYQGGLAQQVGDVLSLGRPATSAEIQGFAAANPAAYAQVDAGVSAFAAANMNNAAANPLAPLRPLQLLPPFLNVPNAVEDGKTDDDDFSYTVRLAYDLSYDLNAYLSYATGFKASSINLSRDSRPFPGDRQAITDAGLLLPNLVFRTRYAGPEESTVYEFGMKGNWDFLSANLAVFYQEIEGFQSNIFTGTGFALVNAGKQSTFGVELETQLRPVDGLTLSLAGTYLDPTYDDFEFSAVGNLSGTRPAGVPELSGSLGARYDWALDNGDDIIFNAAYYFETETSIVEGLPGFLGQGTAAAIAAADQFSRSVDEVSASVTYAMDNGLELSVWGRNLLDDRYLQSIFDSVAQSLAISGYPNQPRTYGVSARFKW